MKQMRFLMVALTLAMGLSLTSCLDSDSDYTNVMYARAKSFMGLQWFEGPDGNRYYPTAASVAAMESSYGYDMSEADLSLVYYKLIENGEHSSSGDDTTTKAGEGTTTPLEFDIELTAAAAVDSKTAKTVQSVEEVESYSVNNAPIYSIKPLISDISGTRESSAWFYGYEMMVIPVQWCMTNDVDKLTEHTFDLTYVQSDVLDTDTLTLYLTHDRGGDIEEPKDEETGLAWAARDKAFDVESILTDYNTKTGNYPKVVKVMMKQNDAPRDDDDEEDPLEMPENWSVGASYDAYKTQQ